MPYTQHTQHRSSCLQTKLNFLSDSALKYHEYFKKMLPLDGSERNVVGGTFAVQQLAVVCHTLFKATGVPNNSSQSARVRGAIQTQ